MGTKFKLYTATKSRSEPGVFPIAENDVRINERTIEARSIRTLTAGGNSGGLHSSMTLVKTLQGSDTLNTIRSGGRGSLTDKHSWDIVQIGAFRGRNPENPKSRESGLPTEQMLEINKEGVSNTLTSVHKDNVVIGTWRTHKDGNGFREIKENISPTIPARAREDGSGQPVINENAQIRRLTEIECERLQGFHDNWTEYGNYDGVIKKIPKTQRYKMLGNAVTVKVVEEIAKLLKIN